MASHFQTKVRFGVVQAVNANVLHYLRVKANRMAVANIGFLAVRRVAKAA